MLGCSSTEVTVSRRPEEEDMEQVVSESSTKLFLLTINIEGPMYKIYNINVVSKKLFAIIRYSGVMMWM